MNRKRLILLRDKLKRVAKNRGNLIFNLHLWAGRIVGEGEGSYFSNLGYVTDTSPDSDSAITAKRIEKALKGDNECGTCACACGIAATIPSFKKAGLYLHGDKLKFSTYTNTQAAEAFFELDQNTCERLFLAFSYPLEERTDPLAVAARIDAVLAEDAASRPKKEKV